MAEQAAPGLVTWPRMRRPPKATADPGSSPRQAPSRTTGRTCHESRRPHHLARAGDHGAPGAAERSDHQRRRDRLDHAVPAGGHRPVGGHSPGTVGRGGSGLALHLQLVRRDLPGELLAACAVRARRGRHPARHGPGCGRHRRADHGDRGAAACPPAARGRDLVCSRDAHAAHRRAGSVHAGAARGGRVPRDPGPVARPASGRGGSCQVPLGSPGGCGRARLAYHRAQPCRWGVPRHRGRGAAAGGLPCARPPHRAGSRGAARRHGAGPQPIGVQNWLPPLVAVAGVLILVDSRWRVVRTGSVAYGLTVLAAVILPTPVGSNIERLGELLAAPVVAGLATKRGLTAVTAGAAAAGVWLAAQPAQDLMTGNAPPFAPQTVALARELRRLHAGTSRVEAVPEYGHWESQALAGSFWLARGWERQADMARNPLFYRGTLT